MTTDPDRPGLSGFVADHIQRYLATDGADGYLLDMAQFGSSGKLPIMLLTTTGRHSGRQLVLPLVFGEADNGYVLIGSRAGAPQHPGWYFNLVAHPEVGVQIRDLRLRARARTVTGAERAPLWQMMAGLFPPYEDYQRKTGREIPVVMLEPLSA